MIRAVQKAVVWSSLFVAAPLQVAIAADDPFQGTFDQHGQYIDAHETGGVVVSGTFQGDILIQEQPLSSPSKRRGFLVRYDPGGQLQWAHSYQRPGSLDYPVGWIDVAIDADGSVAIVGYGYNGVQFGEEPVCDAATSYLVLFNPKGEYQWCRRTGAEARAVDFDNNSNIVIAGVGIAPVDFGGGDVTPEGRNRTGFVATFDRDGDHISSYAVNGTAEEIFLIKEARVGATGNLFLAGYDPGFVQLTCVSATGEELWTRKSNIFGRVSRIALDPFDRLILVGEYSDGPFGFGSDLLPDPDPTGAWLDAYAVVFDSEGTLEWIRAIGGLGDDDLSGVGPLPNGQFMVFGASNRSFEIPEATVELEDQVGWYSPYQIVFDAEGQVTWFRVYGDVHQQTAGSMASTSSGKTYVTGSFKASLDLGGSPLYRSGRYDAYVGAFDASYSHLWSEKIGDVEVVPVAIGSFGAQWRDDDLVFEVSTAVPGVSLTAWQGDARHTQLDLLWRMVDSGKFESTLVGAPADGGSFWLQATWGESTQWLGPIEVEARAKTSAAITIVPNPSGGSQEIHFRLSRTEKVTVDVVDVRGRRVCRLLDTTLGSGPRLAVWNGADDRGSRVSNGIYFVRVNTSDRVRTSRILRMDGR